MIVTFFITCLQIVGFSCALSVSDFKTIEVSGPTPSCIFVSLAPIWPYKAGDFSQNFAQQACDSMGMSLTMIDNEIENDALLQMIRCKMSDIIGKKDPVLVGYSPNFPQGVSAGHKCHFQKYDGTLESSNDLYCDEGYTPTSEPFNKQVHFACKKNSACEKIPNCAENSADPSTCYMKFTPNGPFTDLETKCSAARGTLPRPTSIELANSLWTVAGGNVWIGLTTNTPTANIAFCKGIQNCIQSSTLWYWKGSETYPEKSFTYSDASGITDMWVDTPSQCTILEQGGRKFNDKTCSGSNAMVCLITLGSPGIGSSIATPDYKSDEIICGAVPTPPAESKLAADPDSDQPVVMCPGESAKYTCNTVGINALKSDPKKSTYEIKCKPDRTYAIPNPWPVCVEKLDCPVPYNDPGVMMYDWTSSVGLTPPFAIRYNCTWPNKMLIKKSDLDTNSPASLEESMNVNCQINGTYDINMEKYACTKPCPFPSLSDPEIMKHSWVDAQTKPEIFQTVMYQCLGNKQLVSKKAFETGANTTLYDEMMSICQVSGWLNETIGSFTCTKDCGAPTNYSEIFSFDWDESINTTIGTKVKYVCNNPEKKVVNLEVQSSSLLSSLDVECLYNGQWNANISQWGCTECLRINDPPNGKIECESMRYALGSKCYLNCDAGYIPVEKTVTTCKYETKLGDFTWDVEPTSFMCTQPIGFLIGGIDSKYNYLNEVEILAPGFKCKNKMATPYPFPVIGSVSGFLLGKPIVCGGGTMNYVECSSHKEGSKVCDRNIECVTTGGESKWCTGPKTNECYTYNFLSKDWTKAINLKTGRAYASSTVTSGGEFYIVGGSSSSAIQKSVEIIYLKGDKWQIKRGVNMPVALIGHCIAQITNKELVVAGGFSSDTNDYNDVTYIYNLVEMTWKTKNWMSLRFGPRMDSNCLAMQLNNEKKIILVGGWNNSAIPETEMFDRRSEKWIGMKKNISDTEQQPSMSQSIRSSALAFLNQKLILAGGVKCSGRYDRLQVCERIDSVFELSIGQYDQEKRFYDASWELTGDELAHAKSSHDLLELPMSYGGCSFL